MARQTLAFTDGWVEVRQHEYASNVLSEDCSRPFCYSRASGESGKMKYCCVRERHPSKTQKRWSAVVEHQPNGFHHLVGVHTGLNFVQ